MIFNYIGRMFIARYLSGDTKRQFLVHSELTRDIEIDDYISYPDLIYSLLQDPMRNFIGVIESLLEYMKDNNKCPMLNLNKRGRAMVFHDMDDLVFETLFERAIMAEFPLDKIWFLISIGQFEEAPNTDKIRACKNGDKIIDMLKSVGIHMEEKVEEKKSIMVENAIKHRVHMSDKLIDFIIKYDRDISDTQKLELRLYRLRFAS